MRFYFLHFLFVFLLLVALTCVAEGNNVRVRRGVWDNLATELEKIKETSMKKVTDIMDLFHRSTTPEPETTESTLDSEWPGTSPDYRQIIVAPIRCPPNHVIVKGRCRLSVRR